MVSTSRAARRVALGLVTFALAGCNALLGNEPWTPDGDAGLDGEASGPPLVRTDSGTPLGTPDSSSSGVDSSVDSAATPVDSSVSPRVDSSLPPADTAPPDTGSGLSPLLVLPPSSGGPCLLTEGDSDCAQGDTYRISGVTAGTCDTYDSSVLQANGPCSADSDCGDGMQCYSGECKILCPLGEGCAGGCECLDVGNETTGICCPGT